MSCAVGECLKRFGNNIRLLETHDASTTNIIRTTTSDDGHDQFHGQWVSGLTQTTLLGVPDTELITPLTRANLISTSGNSGERELCIAFDADSGGPAAEIPTLVTTLARKGVSMVIIEDKEVFEPGQKVNSLAVSSASQGQADPQEFAKVLSAFKHAKSEDYRKDMYITARIESFTCRKVIKSDDAAEKASVAKALKQALDRAAIYKTAGADAIMIHSKSKSPDEVLAFLRQFRAQDQETPLVVVPTTYGTTHEKTLFEAGANVVIYANHLMRAKLHVVGRYVDSGATQVDKVCPADLAPTITARNFGYLMRTLQMERSGSSDGRLRPGFEEFLAEAERLAYRAMQDTARGLLNGKEAGAADEFLVPVKTLLDINAIHLSDMGRPLNNSPRKFFTILRSGPLYKNIPVLRTMTRMLA
ncbi:phosphoenolpyruvate phosphomutase-domain-containing protein [Xylariaceae sp. FL0255]|nr:phosphoenolpyruvate phosphomutase-domain-containing protein [Xylariaceae sp. FL0255]